MTVNMEMRFMDDDQRAFADAWRSIANDTTRPEDDHLRAAAIKAVDGDQDARAYLEALVAVYTNPENPTAGLSESAKRNLAGARTTILNDPTVADVIDFAAHKAQHDAARNNSAGGSDAPS